jgi:hypothetical protein
MLIFFAIEKFKKKYCDKIQKLIVTSPNEKKQIASSQCCLRENKAMYVHPCPPMCQHAHYTLTHTLSLSLSLALSHAHTLSPTQMCYAGQSELHLCASLVGFSFYVHPRRLASLPRCHKSGMFIFFIFFGNVC